MLDLEEAIWTTTEVEAGAITCVFWEDYPVMRYQKVQWVAFGDRYTTDGYFN